MADRETDWGLGGTARAAEVWSCFSGPAWRAPQGGGAESGWFRCATALSSRRRAGDMDAIMASGAGY